MKILIVEDEFLISKVVRKAVERDGHEARVCERASSALAMVRSWQPGLIILDVGLPDGDGRDVLRTIRSFSDVPVIFVTARGEEADRIAGLEVGADDYLAKPFSMGELLARIRAIGRRVRPQGSWSARRLQHRNLVLDLEQHRAFLGNEPLDLSNKEFDILRLLMAHPGRMVPRDEVCQVVWGLSAAEAGKSLDVHLSWIRKKLGDDPRNPRYLETVRGAGFRLVD